MLCILDAPAVLTTTNWKTMNEARRPSRIEFAEMVWKDEKEMKDEMPHGQKIRKIVYDSFLEASDYRSGATKEYVMDQVEQHHLKVIKDLEAKLAEQKLISEKEWQRAKEAEAKLAEAEKWQERFEMSYLDHREKFKVAIDLLNEALPIVQIYYPRNKWFETLEKIKE